MFAAIALSDFFSGRLGGKTPGGKDRLNDPYPDLIVPGEWDALARCAKGCHDGQLDDSLGSVDN